MASVVFTPEFICDLQSAMQPHFGRNVLSHVFDEAGIFKADREDHPYKGIAGGWIRWVSMGGAALRVIYIRRGGTVYLYRAVVKADEPGISPPSALTDDVIAEGLPEDLLASMAESEGSIKKRLLKNTSATFLRDVIRRMYHVPHREIVLVAPHISGSLLGPFAEFGKFIDRAVEEGTRIILITLPAGESSLATYEDLERRNIEVYFVQNLRARLFLFQVDPYRSRAIPEETKPVAVMGSADLTHHGFGIGEVGATEELCYRFPETHFSPFREYAEQLRVKAQDLQGHKLRLRGSLR